MTTAHTAPRPQVIVETAIPVRECGHCGGTGELYPGTADGVRCGVCDGLGRVYVLRRPGEYVTQPHHPEGLLRIASLAGVVDDLGRFTCYVTERAARIAVASTPLEAAYWLCPLGLMRVKRG